jgi:predicted transcriptional regulator
VLNFLYWYVADFLLLAPSRLFGANVKKKVYCEENFYENVLNIYARTLEQFLSCPCVQISLCQGHFASHLVTG